MFKLEHTKLFLTSPFKYIARGVVQNHELIHKKQLVSKFGKSELSSVPFPKINNEVEISPYIFQTGNSTIPDIILLKYLASKIENCNFLEIGSWRGETLKNLEEYCNSMTSVTLGKEEMKNMGLSSDFINQNGMFQKTIKNLKQVFANSHNYDFSQLNQKFDLIFIDGDHSYNGVLNDTKKVFEHCVHENTIVVWHDYKDNYGIRYSVLAGVLDGIPKNLVSNLFHVKNTLCCIFSVDTRIFNQLEVSKKQKINLETKVKVQLQ